MRRALLPHTLAPCAAGLPALYGIVLLLDDAYALAPGGRSELVVAASTPELQVGGGAAVAP